MGILAAVAAALFIPAGAGAAAPAPVAATHVNVGPSSIRPDTNVVIRFAQPQTTGKVGSEKVTESLRISGPSRTGCVGSDTAVLAPATVGTMMHLTLRPAPLGGAWCTGRYRGALMVASEPSCLAGPIHTIGDGFVACPMFMMAPRTVATFHFQVFAG
jgi:hypothetical protein